MDSTTSELTLTASYLDKTSADLPTLLPTYLHRLFQQSDCLSFFVPPSHVHTSTGILTRFPSAALFSLALGADSLREDYLYPENLGISANKFLTYFIVTHVSIITSLLSDKPCRFAFVLAENALLPLRLSSKPEASAVCLAPLHFRRRIIRPVSCYAFFKRWLLLSQRPGCLNDSTALTTEHTFGDLSCQFGLFPFRQRTLAPAV